MLRKITRSNFPLISKLPRINTNPIRFGIRSCFSSTPNFEVFDSTQDSSFESYFDKQHAQNKKIESLLEGQEHVDISKPKKLDYDGFLVVVPTPIGNLKDFSLRNYLALREADIIACENKGVAKKLMKLLDMKGIGDELNRMYFDYKDSLTDEEHQFLGGFEKTQKERSDEHKSFSEMKREKQKLRDQLQIDQYDTVLKESHNILKDLDTFNFYDTRKKKERDEDEQMNNQEAFYSSQFKHSKTKSFYGLDDPLLEEVKSQIVKNRLKYNHGLLMSVNRFNEKSQIDKLIRFMKGGLQVALISDAGTPSISDPGYFFVAATLKEQLRVKSHPGPSSVSVALNSSGLPIDKYNFQGFLPKKQYDRERVLTSHKGTGESIVIFEGKSRVLKTLNSIKTVYGEKQIVYLGLELTKQYEKNMRGEVNKLLQILDTDPNYKSQTLKGELTMVIAPFTPEFNKGNFLNF